MRIEYLVFLLPFLLLTCSEDDDDQDKKLSMSATNRNYHMGFTSWNYGPTLGAVDSTYAFIAQHADIYAEHIDNKIPWKAWINNQNLPTAFEQDIRGKVSRKIPGKELLLSISLLNSNRDELEEDWDGSRPIYQELDDSTIRKAYFKHVEYLVNQFQPDYLVISIEVNELLLRAPQKWAGYKRLMADVSSKIKGAFPNLKIAESVSLHNWYQSTANDPAAFEQEIKNQIAQHDFVAISFYPFLTGLSSKAEFQAALDYLHSQVNLPIAFVETSHIAEDLIIPNLNISILGNESEQNIYLETLVENAEVQNYQFIIWWAYRDYDALWQTFPPAVKDLGKIWRDTGLLDEDGNQRSAYQTWINNFNL